MSKFILFVAVAIVAAVTLPIIAQVVLPIVNQLAQFGALLSSL